MNLYIYLYFF